MKKIIIFIFSVLILLMNSCTVQEKMSAEIFAERLIKSDKDIIITESILSDNNKYIFFFSDKNNCEYVCEISADENGNSKKICLACVDTSKTDSFKIYSEKIINTYAPSEDSASIISNLFNDNWDYTVSQWYKYSSVITDKGLFFSIENMKLSTDTDAELTLKQNDILNP